jgi:hypothetical protein
MSDQSLSNPTPVRINNKGNSRDATARTVSYCALLITILIFLFGDNIAGRIYFNVIVPQQGNQTAIEGIIALLNVVLAIFVLVDIWILHPVVIPNDDSIASNSIKQLLRGWKLLWFTWLLFYGCLTAQWLHLIGNEKANIFWQISDGLNVLNGFFFYYLFFVLDQESVPTKDAPHRAAAFRRNYLLTLLLGVVLFAISAVISWSNNFGEGQSLNKGVLLSKLVPAYIAVGMAFFIGRLDSHYLRLHRVTLAPLYLYAIIQLFWGRNTVELSSFDGERVAIFSLALILKFVVFLTLSKLIRHESFRQYFIDAEMGLRER